MNGRGQSRRGRRVIPHGHDSMMRVVSCDMHHPRSTSKVLRFRLAAILLLGTYLLAFPIFGLLARATLTNNFELTLVGLALVIPALVLLVVQWIVAAHTGCPLCRTPILAPRSCNKNRRAKTILGSYRLKVALAVMFKNRFRCPYCNEHTSLELKETVYLPQPRRAMMDQLQSRGRSRVSPHSHRMDFR
jgi:hypothetical protein